MGFWDGIACALAGRESCEKRRHNGAGSTNAKTQCRQNVVGKYISRDRRQRIAEGIGTAGYCHRRVARPPRRHRARQDRSMARTTTLSLAARTDSSTRCASARSSQRPPIDERRWADRCERAEPGQSGGAGQETPEGARGHARGEAFRREDYQGGNDATAKDGTSASRMNGLKGRWTAGPGGL